MVTIPVEAASLKVTESSPAKVDGVVSVRAQFDVEVSQLPLVAPVQTRSLGPVGAMVLMMKVTSNAPANG